VGEPPSSVAARFIGAGEDAIRKGSGRGMSDDEILLPLSAAERGEN